LQVEYRQLFLKDLKKLKKQPVYKKVFNLGFEVLPNAESLQKVSNIKAMKDRI
jgi:mRNA interferase RelE/StbE